MSEFNLVGPTYTATAKNSDCERCVNWYPEMVESTLGKGRMSLECTPGYVVANEFPSQTVGGATRARINGHFEDQEVLWVVASGSLWKLASGSWSKVGNLVNGAGRAPDDDDVRIESNGQQLLIVASQFLTVGQGVWLVDIATGSITCLTGSSYSAIASATQCGYLDGYFILHAPVDSDTGRWSQRFYISELYDGSSWSGLDYFSAESNPDRIIAIKVAHREIWAFGRRSTDVFMNTGAIPNPIERVPGGALEYGILAPRSLQRVGGQMIWLSGDAEGTGMVVRANGYLPERVSNHAVEAAINQAGLDLENCWAWTYTEAGHSFYALWLAQDRACWVLDLTTSMWHERGDWNVAGDFIALPWNAHTFYKQRHYVSGPNADAIAPAGTSNPYGLLWEQRLGYLGRGVDPIRRMRIAPHLSKELAWTYYHELWVDVETQAPSSPVVLPVLHLQWSDDGGKSWSSDRAITLPQPGTPAAAKFRPIWRRLGRARDRVFMLWTEAQARTSVINGYLKSSAGTGI